MEKEQLIAEISRILGKDADLVQFAAGDIIIRQGTRTPFYIIKSGVCRVFVHDKRGGEVLLSELKEGSTIGDMSNFSNSLTSANVMAVSDMVLYKIAEADFDRLLRDIPTLPKILYAQLCLRLEYTNTGLSKKFDDLLELNAQLEHIVANQVSDLQKKNEELEKLMKSYDHFISVAVHDLRSPLSNVIGFIDLLKEALPRRDEQVDMISDVIAKNCHTMLELINDILDIAKIKNNKVEMKFENLPINAVVQQIVDNCSMVIKNKGMKLAIEIANNLPLCVYDPKRLLEVLINLVSNAIKFSTRGSTVTIGAQVDGGFMKVYVKDQGQGIPEAEMHKLFKEFQQISTRSTEGEKGTGLGLAIVDKLVRLHGGTINVDSKVGVGTTFTFTLPLA